ncbi:MAG: NUDIX hydrolase [Lachnospira pectinoschiza]
MCIFSLGLIDEGETPEVAAKRELMEETGLDLIVIEDKLYDAACNNFPMRQMLWLSEKHLEIFRQALQRLGDFGGMVFKTGSKEFLKDNHFARTQAFAICGREINNKEAGYV